MVYLTSRPHNIDKQTPILVFEEHISKQYPVDNSMKNHKTLTISICKVDAYIHTIIKQKQKHVLITKVFVHKERSEHHRVRWPGG